MTTHVERTAAAARQAGVHAVTLSRIQRVSPTVRLLTLALPYAIKFLPGQWVDLHIPTLPSPGGFTITSSPSLATYSRPSPPTRLSQSRPSSPAISSSPLLAALRQRTTSDILTELKGRDHASDAFIELAVQRTSNPPAQWLWRPAEEILGSQLAVRVGGSFVWPPPGLEDEIENVIFVAGGVGINPFMSMLSDMYESPATLPKRIKVLYGTKAASGLLEVLFVERLVSFFDAVGGNESMDRSLELYLTGPVTTETEAVIRDVPLSGPVKFLQGRMSQANILEAVGQGRSTTDKTVAYVCGPGAFVDETVSLLGPILGEDRVLCEKWW